MAEWPTEPTDIIREALREYVGDGDGADEAVLAAHDAEIRFGERERILGGLLRLPITHTQVWDQWGYSVSITDAISVVREEQP